MRVMNSVLWLLESCRELELSHPATWARILFLQQCSDATYESSLRKHDFRTKYAAKSTNSVSQQTKMQAHACTDLSPESDFQYKRQVFTPMETSS